MFTGNLIEDLIATVERAEQQARPENQAIEMMAWSSAGLYETAQVEHKLLGVA
jgi:hypothetical protein